MAFKERSWLSWSKVGRLLASFNRKHIDVMGVSFFRAVHSETHSFRYIIFVAVDIADNAEEVCHIVTRSVSILPLPPSHPSLD